MSRQIQQFYEFGDFRFDTEKRVLWRGQDMVPLPPKASEVLLYLLSDHGDLVERQDLIERVWSNTFVEEGNLNHAISELRKTLGTDVIQTVPRRGYRFVATLRERDLADGRIVLERRTSSTEIYEEHEIVVDEADRKPIGASRASRFRRSVIFSVGAVAISVAAASAWFLFGGRSVEEPIGTPSINNLAVLPLRSFTRDSSDEELRLRITDALITKLGQLDNLAVRPTSSIVKFVGEEQDPFEAGRKLGVDAVLDGRVQEEGGRLRVTLQLISVASGKQLWADQFDGESARILPLQDAISSRLVSVLERRGDDSARQRITTSNEAYEAYLKGRYFWNQRTPDSYIKSINYFQDAIRKDPGFALAYSGLADSYVLINRRLDDEPEKLMLRAEAAANRGLELDDTLAETHTSLALVLSAFRRDWVRSNYHFRRAIELNPRYAIGRAWYGLNLISIGEFAEAHRQLDEARRLDPTSRNIAVYTMVNYYYSRRFEEAIERGKAAVELDPQLSTAHMFLSYAFEQTGRNDDAVSAELTRSESVAPESVESLRTAYDQGGMRGFWLKQVEIKSKMAEQGVNCQLEIATRLAMLGEVDKALRVIEKNFRYGGTCWNGLAYEPAFDRLRSEPRFLSILKEMGFQPSDN